MFAFRSFFVGGLLLSLLWLTGCTYTYTKEVTQSALAQAGWADDYGAARTSAFTLPPGATVYITYPHSSAQISHSIPRFRTQFQDAITDVGRSRGFQGVVGDYQQNFQQAMKDARNYGCDFVFTVVVTQLQAGNNEVRKDNDGFRLMLNIYDVRSHQLLDTFSLAANRGLAPKRRSVDQLIYSSAATLIDRLYAPPGA